MRGFGGVVGGWLGLMMIDSDSDSDFFFLLVLWLFSGFGVHGWVGLFIYLLSVIQGFIPFDYSG